MSIKHYHNFVRPSSSSPTTPQLACATLSGDEAKRLYLEEINDIKDSAQCQADSHFPPRSRLKRRLEDVKLSDKDLFLSAQNNEVDTLKRILDSSPDKINVVDDYGWSLLMIACQANSIDTVKELLKRDIDTSIRDKSGNSAQTLVIKNRNLVLANILVDNTYSKSNKSKYEEKQKVKHKKVKLKQEFTCEICNKLFSDKEEHLTSTFHNLNASKGRKIPTNYVIPVSNRGYQIMLKDGWDKDHGLGPDGSGNKYPIKTVLKKDRKGLGHDKKKNLQTQLETVRHINKRIIERDHYNNRKMEIRFRREFY